jgi:DNA-binding NtrC family response regulator
MGRAVSRKKVIVVEDEETLRDLAAAMLDETDLEVIECASAEAALAYMGEWGSDVALIFTDVWLAGARDGVELAQRVGQQWPGVWVIVTSGNADDRVRHVPATATFMPKPWRALEVLIHAERASLMQ